MWTRPGDSRYRIGVWTRLETAGTEQGCGHAWRQQVQYRGVDTPWGQQVQYRGVDTPGDSRYRTGVWTRLGTAGTEQGCGHALGTAGAVQDRLIPALSSLHVSAGHCCGHSWGQKVQNRGVDTPRDRRCRTGVWTPPGTEGTEQGCGHPPGQQVQNRGVDTPRDSRYRTGVWTPPGTAGTVQYRLIPALSSLQFSADSVYLPLSVCRQLHFAFRKTRQ